MPSYHSVWNKNEPEVKYCGIPVFDFKRDKTPSLDYSKLKVPINQIELDIIDEAIIYFRANVLFKNFSIDGDADKLIVYITVFIQKCLEKAGLNTEPNTAKVNMRKLIDGCEYIPNTENFFNVLVDKKDNEISNLQKYLKEIRKEVVSRLIYILYDNPQTSIDRKFWLALGKKKFMGYDMLSSK
jgi:actin related protein 2/3 complex subunit 3